MGDWLEKLEEITRTKLQHNGDQHLQGTKKIEKQTRNTEKTQFIKGTKKEQEAM